MPFGLKNAPSFFQSLTDTMARSLNFKQVKVYLDDITMSSHEEFDMIDLIKNLFIYCRRHNFKLHPSKSCLFQTRIKVLGHVLDEKGIYPLDKIIARIRGAALLDPSMKSVLFLVWLVTTRSLFLTSPSGLIMYRNSLAGTPPSPGWMIKNVVSWTCANSWATATFDPLGLLQALHPLY